MRNKINSGFTVVEVLIGIGLFGIVMPSIIVGVVNVGRLNDRAADLMKANIVAEEKIESLRNAGFNSLNNGSYNFEAELDPTFAKPRDAAYVVETPTPGIKTIQVNISYDVYGTTKNLSYKSIISELGVAQ